MRRAPVVLLTPELEVLWRLGGAKLALAYHFGPRRLRLGRSYRSVACAVVQKARGRWWCVRPLQRVHLFDWRPHEEAAKALGLPLLSTRHVPRQLGEPARRSG